MKPDYMASGRSLFSRIMFIFGFVMVAVFVGLGIALLLSPKYNWIDPNMKYIGGFFFIAYGLYRFARIMSKLREQKRKEF